MKNVFVTLSALALCFASCKKEVTVETITTETDSTTIVKKPEVKEEPMDSAAIQEAWKAYATPGVQHKMLADETGTWNVEMTFWMEANGQPEKYTSTAQSKMILDGKYQETTYSGTMMGMPFEGKSTVAFNNKSGEFTSTWIDNMGTGMMIVKGHYDDTTKALNMKGDMVDPITGKNITVREVYTIVDANTRKLETFDTKEGQEEYKSMEIVMKRKK
ncbi:DUF1579 domain-containing protein [Flavobacterium sp. Sd200]|uniref:DUF1579 domain-containing protein n=1 Tax=Flavobacterium sp. Sd200 TaxID=2692211 RepID=UPI00136A614C|nr:DUF1579 domain-containing protein [Flavobacterium sp. Sd200]MXN92968.1 DUF1579 domain-containing protein [Flavobacterium sp. Sd200]